MEPISATKNFVLESIGILLLHVLIKGASVFQMIRFTVPFVVLISYCFGLNVRAEQIVVWHQKNGATPFLEAMLAPVAEAYSMELSVTYISTTNLKTALIKAVINKNEPNIALIPSDFFGEHRTLRLQPISEELKNKVKLDRKTWEFATVENVVYGIPLAVGNHLMMYFNKDHVKTPISDWQSLIEQSNKMPEGKRLIGWNYNELYWFINFIPMFGDSPVNSGKINLEQPAVANALKFYKGLNESNVIDRSCEYACSLKRFEQSDISYLISGDWAYKELKHKMGDSLGITTLPAYKEVPMKSFYSALALIFPGDQQSEKEKVINHKLAQILISNQVQSRLFDETGMLPASLDLRKIGLQVNSSDFETISTIIENGIELPSTPTMSAAWAGMRKGFDFYHSNDVSATQASKIMQQAAERQLSKLQANQN
jgi:maltose-binding protein MalE